MTLPDATPEDTPDATPDTSPHATRKAALQGGRAAIVGAGPVGLALALLMARHCPQWSVSLFDARPLEADVSRDPRTLALSLGSLQTLEHLGVWPMAGAQPILEVLVSQDAPAMGLWNARPEVVLRAADLGVEELGAVTAYGALVPALQRAWMRAVQDQPHRLHHRFGQPVRELKVVAAHETPGAQHQVEVDAGIAERFDLAVVAEGGVFMRERTPQQVSIRTAAPGSNALGGLTALVDRLSAGSIRHDYGQTAWVGTVWLSGSAPGRAVERFSRQGPVALLPLPPQATANTGAPNEAAANAGSSHDTAAQELQRASLVWCVRSDDDPVAALDDAQRVAVINAVLPPSAGRIERIGPLKSFALGLQAQTGLVQDGCLMRIGNAAQTLHPVAGQGLNLGLRDASALAHAMRLMQRRGQSLPQVLQQVQQARSVDRWSMIASTDFLARSFTWTLPGAATARALGLLAVEHLPGLKPALARQMMFGRR